MENPIETENNCCRINEHGFYIDSESLDMVYEEDCSQRAATLGYLVPQTMIQKHYLVGKADIWRMGIVFYILLTRRMSFSGKSRSEVENQVQEYASDIINSGLLRKISPNFRRLFFMMLQVDARNRATSQNVCHLYRSR